jgi:hypothetical protein
MKYYTLFIIIALSSMVHACNDNKQNTGRPEEKQEEKKNFFPVADYLKSEIAYVDSMPFRIVKYNIQNDKTDSLFIDTKEFDRLAREFLLNELNDSLFEKNFLENSFLDQTTQLLTFTYSAQNGNSGLKRVDVLATQNPGFDKVKSIYMEENINKKDTSVIRKMYWRARKSFQIITIMQPENRPAISQQLKVVWDNS